jgi:drug/metabolite transporter (DMT)-like permease
MSVNSDRADSIETNHYSKLFMQTIDNRNTVGGAWLILMLLGVVWGSSFILIKKGLLYFSSDEVGALRIVISFLFLLPFTFKRIGSIKGKTWLVLLLSGIIGNGAPAFLFAHAQTVIDSSVAGILNSLTPLFTVIVGIIAFNIKLKWFNYLGVLLGLAGASGLLAISGSGDFSFKFSYAVYVLIATLLYAINVNILKFWLKDVDPISIVVFSLALIGMPVMFYLMFFTGFAETVAAGTEAYKGIAYIAVLAVGGTVLALMLFNKLIKNTDPVFASSVTYLIPVVAVMWGIFDGERFDASYLIWIGMILSGIVLVSSKHPGHLPIIGAMIRKTKFYTHRFGI